MDNFNTAKWFKNQYLKEAYSKLNEESISPYEMEKENDIQKLIKTINNETGLEFDDSVRGSMSDGRRGYYIRMAGRGNYYFENDDVLNLKKAFEKVNKITDKFNYEYSSVSDYETDIDDDRSWAASVSFFAVEKPVNEEEMSKTGIMKQIKDAEEILDSGEANGMPLDNETEMLVQNELKRLRSLFKLVNEVDMNDPVLVKARAAQMADEKEMAKQAELDKKYGSNFMDKLDAEIGLKQEFQDLKDEREQLMIDMEQEAEPEGGEIADRYGSRLNDIDAKMDEIKSELDDLRMYESVNENREAIKETFSFIKENNPEFTNEEIKAELKEIKKLGNQLNEELCAKGKAYRKKRMAAGEKSSAYLSGRAVRVCKGDIKG